MKQVIITIDTEGHKGNDPIERLIWGKTQNGQEYGIKRIMDICDQIPVKAVFFVDIAEAWDYGREKISEVIRYILYRGHDVGVHIHPDHMADRNRLFLWQYDKREQQEIIEKCTELYKEITGKAPIAFRAGKYGANRDTLDILDEFGYKYDFSQFYGQKWCGIHPHVCISLPKKYGGLLEIPVTVFRSFKLGKFKRYDKIDAVMDGKEYKHIMNRIGSDKRNIVVALFYHSFSMLDWREHPDDPILSLREEKKFIDALTYVKESNYFQFINLDELDAIISSKMLDDDIENVISTKGFIKSTYFLIKRAYSIRKSNKKALWLINGLYIAIIIILTIIVLLIYCRTPIIELI